MGTQTTLRNIFISLASSYGIFIISAIMYVDAFHIFTTIIQYIILIPTWINIFTVYAFANLHDTSWGTKGATILQHQSSRLKSMLLDEDEVDDLQQIDMEAMERQHRINLWELSKPVLEEKFSTDKKTRLDDYFRYWIVFKIRDFRTRLMLVWVFSNLILIYLVTATTFFATQDIWGTNAYISFIFALFLFTSIVRLFGTFLYLFAWIFDLLRDAFIADRMFVPKS
jgi:chitin synthase